MNVIIKQLLDRPVLEIISEFKGIHQLYYRFLSERIDGKFRWFMVRCNLAAESFQRAQTHTKTGENLPPTTFHSSETGILICLQPRLSKDHGGGRKLGSAGDMLRGAPTGSSRRTALKGEPGCAGRAPVSQCLHAGPVYRKPLTARSSFMNYFVLTSEAADGRHWKDGLR